MTQLSPNLDKALSLAQRQLLERLLRGKSSEGTHDGILSLPAGTRVPLSSAQARIWFFSRLYPESAEYNIFASPLSFTVSPDRASIEAALRTLMDRHDALHLRIVEIDEEPMQEECTGVEPPLTWHDLSGMSVADAERHAMEIGSSIARTPFKLDQPPLFRVSVIRLPEGKALLLFIGHHVIVDGWSLDIIYEELTELLSGKSLKPAPTIRFLDYVSWERRNVSEQRMAQEMDYWRVKLAGELPVLDIPKDRPRQATISRTGHTVPCSIPSAVIQPLKQLADAENTTLFVALLAAYKAFLLRLTRQTDLIVGAPLAGRDHSITENLIGCFVKTVALRTDLDSDISFREAVRRVRATTLEAQDNQAVPFERIVAELRIPRAPNYSPVFQTLFALQNTPAGVFSSDGVEITDMVLDSESSKWDLTLSLTETAQGASGFMEYSSDLFNEDTVMRFADMYVALLSAMVAEPDHPIGEHRLISARERERILYGLNKYERPNDPFRTMAEPFELQVLRTPDAIALVGDQGTLSYSELNRQANRLAHFLRLSGVRRGSLVALCLDRGFSMIVALYAVAKAGAAYVPLDLELPDARIAFMLDDTSPSIVLVDSAARHRIPQGPWHLVSLDDDSHLWQALSSVNLPCEGPTHHLVHLLYTSGSTGRPKAVAYPVDAAITEILWLHSSYPLASGDANIFKTSYGFDVSIWEIFWTLYFGAKLVVCRPGGHRDPAYLVEMIERHGVTSIFLIPSMLEAFLNELPEDGCRSLRWVICGGAAVTPRLRDTFYAKLDATLIQGYGPTEAGCVTDMVVAPAPGSPVVPLGRPAANYRLYVLDEGMEVCPIGVAGEAYIAGEVGVAQCYHARPDLTAERFLPDPFSTVGGGRMYRTGDICRYGDDGVLEHLGRAGRQVKVRGMRVELTEVEAVLCEQEGVESCAAVAVDDEGGQRILAFVVAKVGGRVEAGELAEQAGRLLPRYMVPASIMMVGKIPTTINGKVDSQALVEVWRDAGSTAERKVVAPEGEIEERMKGVFERVLGCERVGVTESFFELGGHSLLVFKLISACWQEFSYRPTVAEIFSSPTARELSERVTEGVRGSGRRGSASLVPLYPKAGKPLIVFVHAASGSALPFVEVARRLGGEYSTYGLEAIELEAIEEEARSGEGKMVEEMAASYVEAVDEVRGLSPVIIAGWSMGGCVGLEMVWVWRGRGVDVAGMLMLDTLVPPKALVSEVDREEARRVILGMDVLGEEGYVGDEVEGGEEGMSRLKRALERNREAFLEYEPGSYEGEVDYLRAVEGMPEGSGKLPEVYRGAERGWEGRLSKVEVHDIGGSHFSLVGKENAGRLAETIREIVEARLSFGDV